MTAVPEEDNGKTGTNGSNPSSQPAVIRSIHSFSSSQQDNSPATPCGAAAASSDFTADSLSNASNLQVGRNAEEDDEVVSNSSPISALPDKRRQSNLDGEEEHDFITIVPCENTPSTRPPIIVTYPESVSNFIKNFAGMGLLDKDTFCELLGCMRWAIPGVEGALAQPVVRDGESPVCVLTAEQRQEIAAADRVAGRVFLPLIADGQFVAVSLCTYGSGLYRKAVHGALQQVDEALHTGYAAEFDKWYNACKEAYQRKEDEEALSASSRDEPIQ